MANGTLVFTNNDFTSFNPNDTKPYPGWFVVFMWIFTVVFALETIIGNLLVLLAYKIERNIRRQLSNKFIVSLAISDLIIGMEGFPILTVYVLEKERWPLGSAMCKIWLWIDYTLCLVSILTVLLITIDRYCSVCYPAKYRMWQSPKRITLMIIFSWVIPMALFGFMIFAWELMSNEPTGQSVKCYAPFLNNPYVNMSMYIVYYWTTLIAMSILYRGIHIAAKALEDRSKAKEKQTLALMLGQRCMAQVGVGMFMNALSKMESETPDNTNHQTVEVDYAPEYTEMVHDSGYITTTAGTTTLNSDSKSTNHISITKKSDDQVDQSLKVITLNVPTTIDLCTDDEGSEMISKVIEINVIESTILSPDDSHDSIITLNDADFLPCVAVHNEPLAISSIDNSHSRVPSFKWSRIGSSNSFGSRKVKKLSQKYSGDSMDYCDNVSCNSMFADVSISSMLDFDQTVLSPSLEFIEEENDSLHNGESSITLCGRSYCSDDRRATYNPSPVDTIADIDTAEQMASTTTASIQNDLSPDADISCPQMTSETSSSNQLEPINIPVVNLPVGSPPCRSNSNLIEKNIFLDMNKDNVSISTDDRSSLSKKGSIISNRGPILLTVPRASLVPARRSIKGGSRRKSKKDDWRSYRESWQSCLSEEDKERLNKIEMERLKRASSGGSAGVVDDEDSGDTVKQDVMSSNDESSSVENRRAGWMSNLFSNPTWLLTRRRKVTKAEKRARKAFRTITVIVGTFALFWSPYYIVATVYGFCDWCIPPALFFTSYYLCYLNSSMNPFAYAFANRLFRKTFVRILRGDFHGT